LISVVDARKLFEASLQWGSNYLHQTGAGQTRFKSAKGGSVLRMFAVDSGDVPMRFAGSPTPQIKRPWKIVETKT